MATVSAKVLKPISISIVIIGTNGKFDKVFNLRQNDVYFIKLKHIEAKER